MLPALHQLPYKMPKTDGTVSDFADNPKKLKNFGRKNESSEADLLFQFFRFYAHEFDYDKHVLSVRSGKLVTKEEKQWNNFNMNQQLCVEEPFNVSRNLGNTADDYSFRGLHLELRRAFDLISAGKFEEACEQYVFPKEEERVFSRPTPQSRPVMLRSSSQTHSGRGGRGNHRGARHNNFHRGGGGGGGGSGGSSNRRASSSVPAYDTNNIFVPPMNLQQPPEMSWYPTPQYQFQYAQQDLMTQMAYHHENMRQTLNNIYTAQSPALMQHQNMGQQRGPSTTTSGQQSADRSRTNSFDTAPLSAPMRPDLYALYGMTLGHTFYPQPTTYGTHPSSPATVSGTGQDYRRPLQRSTGATDGVAAASSSSLRSQSQPASRPQSSAQPAPSGYHLASQAVNAPVFAPRSVNGVLIPSFIPPDSDFDENPRGPASESPLSEEGKPAAFPARRPSPARQAKPQGLGNAIAFGDLASQTSASGPGRRRLSTDQTPQTILDRRMRRQSRSPSPMGHARAFSVGTAAAPLVSGPFASSQSTNSSRPLVVNGSGLKASVSAGPRSATERAVGMAEEPRAASYLENPLHMTPDLSLGGYSTEPMAQPQQHEPFHQPLADRPPIVVNGSNTMSPSVTESSFRERIANLSSHYMNAPETAQDLSNAGAARQQRLLSSRQPQNGVIAPLDLAIGENRMVSPTGPNLAHLSPVYETRTPSPTALRKFDVSTRMDKPSSLSDHRTPRSESSNTATKAEERMHNAEGAKSQKAQKSLQQQQPPKNTGARENGHARGKSEIEGVWQKAGKAKKKVAAATGHGHAEQPPKHDSERKGG